MPRYYLHLRDFKGDVLMDEEGAELPSLAAAREDAILAMQDFVAAAVRHGDEPPFEAIVVTDEHGTQLAAVPLLAALPPTIVGLLTYSEKIVPADRFAEFRRHADECRGKAEDAVDPDDKMSWLKLADAWLRMLPPIHSPSGGPAGWPKGSDEDSQASH